MNEFDELRRMAQGWVALKYKTPTNSNNDKYNDTDNGYRSGLVIAGQHILKFLEELEIKRIVGHKD